MIGSNLPTSPLSVSASSDNAPKLQTCNGCKKVILSIGCNIPPKKANLQKALYEISKRKIATLLLLSPFYRTPAWGKTDQEWFLNGCVLMETALSPHDLLIALQKIEDDMGRDRAQMWGERPIDLDILVYEGVDHLDTPTLKIPHPLMTKRAFVLTPLKDITPWMGIGGKSIDDWLKLTDKAGMSLYPIKDDPYEEIIAAYWENLNPRDIKPGLDRILRASEELGSPHQKLPPVIHIAGTNGKGSTLAFLRSLLTQAGKSAHCYTSPHLISYKERFIIGRPNGEARFTAPDEFERAAMRVAPLIRKHGLSHFEALTLTGFLLFSETPADFTLLETGMGGRSDATTIAENVIAACITSVSYDHTEFLGADIKQIAFEKAGIIRPKVPVVLSARDADAREVISQVALSYQSPLYALGDRWDVSEEDNHDVFIYSNESEEFAASLAAVGLEGVHQSDNAGAALTLAKIALGSFPKPEVIERGLTYVKWPARLQTLTQEDTTLPLPKDLEILLDGAHNAEGAELFGMTLADMQDADPKANVIMLSIKAGKEPDPFFQALKDISPKPFLFFIRNSGASEQIDPDLLADYAEQYGFGFEIFNDWKHFIGAFIHPDISATRLSIFGSLYLCGAFLKLVQYKIKI